MAKQNIAIEPEVSSIGALIRKAEQNFISGNNHISKYVYESPYEDISKIEAYLNSKHTSGEFDALGREKPFFNIVLAIRNIYYRATDIDRKNIKFKANNSKEIIPAFITNIIFQKWMKKFNFGTFLNSWGLDLSGYNSSIVKFVEKDNELHRQVISWNRIICDFIDFSNNPKIEILEFTPAQLKLNKSYNQKIVDNLMTALSTRENNAKQKKDNKNDYIKLYEIHGNLPKSYLTGKKEDEYTFVQQMQVITFVSGKSTSDFDDFILYKGQEEKDPYMLTSLIPATDGSVSLMGSVKSSFDAQWMTNHTAKLIKDQLDLASKLIFQTADQNFLSQNALTSIEQGDILVHTLNQPITQIQNNSHDIVSLQNYGIQWKSLSSEINGISESMMGLNPPSGTAWKQTEALLTESHSLFELMTENKELALEDMIRTYIIPHIKKTALNNTEELSSLLSDADIKIIDGKYIKNEAIKRTNQQIINKILNNETVLPQDHQIMMQKNSQDIKTQLNENGNQRFFKPSEITSKMWSDLLNDYFDSEPEIELMGENTNKQTDLTTLTTALQSIASNPTILENPTARMLFNKILQSTGVVSPLELVETPIQSNQTSSNPSGVGTVGSGMINLSNNLTKK